MNSKDSIGSPMAWNDHHPSIFMASLRQVLESGYKDVPGTATARDLLGDNNRGEASNMYL